MAADVGIHIHVVGEPRRQGRRKDDVQYLRDRPSKREVDDENEEILEADPHPWFPTNLRRTVLERAETDEAEHALVVADRPREDLCPLRNRPCLQSWAPVGTREERAFVPVVNENADHPNRIAPLLAQ